MRAIQEGSVPGVSFSDAAQPDSRASERGSRTEGSRGPSTPPTDSSRRRGSAEPEEMTTIIVAGIPVTVPADSRHDGHREMRRGLPQGTGTADTQKNNRRRRRTSG